MEDAAAAAGEPPTYSIRYVAQHGFECEVRRVAFTSVGFLEDMALKERLPWRTEGGEHVEDAEGPVDDEVEEYADSDADAEVPLPLHAQVSQLVKVEKGLASGGTCRVVTIRMRIRYNPVSHR